ncbi:MAG: TonB-dependent receptor [Pseudomonadota bacterium]
MINTMRTQCLALTAAGMLMAPVQAQDSPAETLIVTGTRLAEEPFDQPYAFYRTTADELNVRIGRLALDRLNYGPGVFVQRTAPNQASPFIRGLTGEQTLLMLDGIRLSHAFMRPGPNQYAALVPDSALSAVDVILGSSSTVNGSDGLSGALDFRLAQAGRGVEDGASFWGRTRVDTGNGSTLEAGVDGAAGGWAYSVEASGSFFDDRVGGQDFRDHVFGTVSGDEIPNTAYDAFSAGLRLSFSGFDDHLLEFNAGHKRQEDAPRPDGYFENTGRSDRIFRFFDPQTFTFVHLKDSWDLGGAVVDRLDTKLWWHQHAEEQFRSSFRNQGTPDELVRRREFDNTIDALGIDVQATTLLGDDTQHELTWGFTYIAESTDNAFREFRTPAGSTALADLAPHNPEDWTNNTTVSDGSSYDSLGLFIQDDWRLSDSVSLLVGLRYSAYEWSFGNVDGDTDDFTGNVRALWSVTDNHRLFAGVSRGFRAPNLTNLDGVVERGSSGTPASGNPDLDPEVSVSLEAGWKWRSGADSAQLTLFQTRIDDLIQRDFSATPAITTNVEDADLYGFESAWDLGLATIADRRVALVGSMSLLNATRDIPEPDGSVFEDNISRANRFYGNLGLEYGLGRHWTGLVQVRWHDTYDDVATHPSDSDANDVRLTVAGNPDGSLPGYGVIDLVFGWQGERASVRLFAENLADKTYREPGSGVDGVGRNLGAIASVRF